MYLKFFRYTEIRKLLMEMIQLIKEADDLIRKIVSRYNGLYTQYGKVSQIELDIMLDEIRQLYEKFKVIGQLNMMPPVLNVEKPAQSPDRPAAPQEQPATVRKAEPKEVPPVQAMEEKPVQTAETVQQPVAEEKVVEEEPKPVIPEPPKAEIPVAAEPATIEKPLPPKPAEKQPMPAQKAEPQPKPDKTPRPVVVTEESKATLADTFRNEQKSLSETMAPPTGDSSLSSRLQAQPISDLKAAIGLNERFNFISDLFENDLLGYDEAIRQLNGAPGKEEATSLLTALGEKYHWNDSIPAMARFTEFVHRRFL
jgi:hypothetical protein